MSRYDRVVLGHGGGGKLSGDLIEGLMVKELGNEMLNVMHDGAVFEAKGALAFSTDSFVVDPIFFPGGDIGELAVYGTVNDISCCGARPQYLSLSLIIEEGLPMEHLQKIIRSVKLAAERSGVQIITGDTKVVEKGKGDKIFINTSGVGSLISGVIISPASCRPGDKILLNGYIGDHGIAIISSREGIRFETTVKSDCAPLNRLIEEICLACPSVSVFRDPTRGGVASALNEISKSSGYGIKIYENRIPVRDEVRGACEILGFDPLYVANEGKVIVIVPGEQAEMVLGVMKNNPLGCDSEIIGEVTAGKVGVSMQTVIGSSRIVDMISGEQLPRIC
ncbi:MAG: hydrogenase expression/formation protein HypE [Bacteroidia bacterium]|nr:MAG: hydrogenase expression/formation protein HypE [Bacteroidia bacterium]